MQWFYLSLLSLLLFSISKILQRKLLRDNKNLNPVIFGFIFQVLVGLFAIPMFLAHKELIDITPKILTYIIIAGIFYAASNFFAFRAIKITEISRIGVIGSSASLWVLIGSVLLLGEKITASNIIGVLLIISSLAIILDGKIKKSEVDKGQIIALFATILSGFAVTIDGLILKEFPVALYIVISSLFTGIGTLAFDPGSIYSISPHKDKKTFATIIFAAAIFSVAVFLMYTSYTIGGKMAAIIPITQSSAVITIFLSIFMLGETKDLPKKIIAITLSIIGIRFLK